MKLKLITAFFTFVVFVVTLIFIFTSHLNNSLDINKEKGQTLVDINDILKVAQSYLESQEVDQLYYVAEQIGFDLVIYTLDGEIICDNKNKDNLGKKYDVTKMLSEANLNKQIFTLNYKNKNAREYAIAVIDTNEKQIRFNEIKDKVIALVWSIGIVFILFTSLILLLIYIYILRPFRKLENFAGEVAKGNLEAPLIQEHHNFFGAFTWAFDMLRKELKTSKEREDEAQRTKKELVAVLSHDIRTPIASIKAYAECLKSLPDKDSERAQRYLEVIINKTDEIAKLSQDMFLHAISDLEKLEVSPAEYCSRELLNSIIEPLILHYENRIIITNAFPNVTVFTDEFRLAQVLENIISNSAKYAPKSNIEISSYVEDDYLKCCFKDYGDSVLPEDMPFLFDKFFRGKNAKENGLAGTGLGLYISKYILEKTAGQIKAFAGYENEKKVFVIEISLRIIKS